MNANHLFSKREYNFFMVQAFRLLPIFTSFFNFSPSATFLFYISLILAFKYICYHIGAIFHQWNVCWINIETGMRVLLIFFFTLLCISTYVHNAPTWPTMVLTIVPIRPCRVYLGYGLAGSLEYPKQQQQCPGLPDTGELLPSTIRDLLHWVYLARRKPIPHYRKATQHLKSRALRQLRCWKRRCYRTETGDTLWMSVLSANSINDDPGKMWVGYRINNFPGTPG